MLYESDVCHPWPVRFYSIFPHYLKNGTIFENKLFNIKCVSIFSTNLSVIFLILRKNLRQMIRNVFTTAPVILVRFRLYLAVLDRFWKNTRISNFMKIRRVGAELFHADGQTDIHDKVNSRCLQFFNCAYKKYKNPRSA
jgi:hypothetical protein